MASQSWTAQNGARVKAAVESIARAVASGEISAGLRPLELDRLSGDAARLYRAALTEQCPAKWAKIEFPRGFDSLVTRVNALLVEMSAEIRAFNDKRAHVSYVSHSGYELQLILSKHQEYLRGEISREAAVRELGGDGVTLSPGQESTYFRESLLAEAPDAASIKDLKKVLLHRIKALRDVCGIELLDRDCQKGVVFEAFVGCVLRASYPEGQIVPQYRVAIPYRDLSGKRHSNAYLDYLVNARQIVEVKWCNTFDNIVSSILPQREGLARQTLREPEALVVFRHPCPEMTMAVRFNTSVEAEASRMELDRQARPVRELFVYRSIGDFITEIEDPSLAAILHDTLARLDDVVTNATLREMEVFGASLDRIQRNTDRLATGLTELCKLDLNRPYSADVLDAQFGTLNDRDRTTLDAVRRKTIERSQEEQLDKTLLDLFNRLRGTSHDVLSAEMVRVLAGNTDDTLGELIVAHAQASRDRRSERRTRPKAGEVSLAERHWELAMRYLDRSRQEQIERAAIIEREFDDMMRPLIQAQEFTRTLAGGKAISLEGKTRKERLLVQHAMLALGCELPAKETFPALQRMEILSERLSADVRESVRSRVALDRFGTSRGVRMVTGDIYTELEACAQIADDASSRLRVEAERVALPHYRENFAVPTHIGRLNPRLLTPDELYLAQNALWYFLGGELAMYARTLRALKRYGEAADSIIPQMGRLELAALMRYQNKQDVAQPSPRLMGDRCEFIPFLETACANFSNQFRFAYRSPGETLRFAAEEPSRDLRIRYLTGMLVPDCAHDGGIDPRQHESSPRERSAADLEGARAIVLKTIQESAASMKNAAVLRSIDSQFSRQTANIALGTNQLLMNRWEHAGLMAFSLGISVQKSRDIRPDLLARINTDPETVWSIYEGGGFAHSALYADYCTRHAFLMEVISGQDAQSGECFFEEFAIDPARVVEPWDALRKHLASEAGRMETYFETFMQGKSEAQPQENSNDGPGVSGAGRVAGWVRGALSSLIPWR